MLTTPRLLASLACAVALVVAPASAQEGVPPTRRQRQSLTPLIQLYAERLAPHLASLSYKRVERQVRKALTDQASRVARKQLEEALVRLIAVDVGVDTKAGRVAVKRELLAAFARELLPGEQDLLGADFEAGAYAPKMALLQYRHARVVRHDPDMLEDLRGLLQSELSSGQARGMKDLAAFYAPLFTEIFRVERPDRSYAKLLEEALATEDTRRAMLAALTLQRILARPAVRRVYDVQKAEDIVETEALVRERVVKELEESGLLERLADDHRAMLDDPRGHRKVLAERRKKKPPR